MFQTLMLSQVKNVLKLDKVSLISSSLILLSEGSFKKYAHLF